jgi:pimeloyl-ACP methyl ester carboxylesterase
MLEILMLLLGFLAPPDGSSTDPLVSPAEFRTWFDAAREGSLDLPAEVLSKARRLRYVFVGGFGSERMPGYFALNARELRARGVPRDAIHFIFPSSHETFDANADEVREHFFAIAREGPEPLVIIAHSRGACDALAFALREPEFVRDRVEALFLIQGPFGGTALADYIRGEGPAMDRLLPMRFRIVVHLCGQFERFLMKRGRHGGLPGLTRWESRAYWSRLLDENADAIPIVGPKTYYIQSEVPASRLGLFRRSVGKYLSAYDGPNDGVVAVEDQQLPGLGTCLGIFDCGHGDLTGRSRSGRSNRRLPGVLVQSILMAVGRLGNS